MSLHHWLSWRQNHPHETPWLRLVLDPSLGVAGQTRLQGPVTEGDVVEEHREEPGAVPGLGWRVRSSQHRHISGCPVLGKQSSQPPCTLAQSPQRLLGPAAFLALLRCWESDPARPQGRGSLPPLSKGRDQGRLSPGLTILRGHLWWSHCGCSWD